MTLNIEDAPSNEQILLSKRNARARVKLWKKRSLSSAAGFFLNCAVVASFLFIEPLHAYWDSFGKYLVILAGGVSFIVVYCTTLWWYAWSILRYLEKIYPSAGGAP